MRILCQMHVVNIVVVSALCSSRRGHMHTMSTADGSVTSPSYGDAGGTSAVPPTSRRTFVLRKLPSDGILASCTGVLRDTIYCLRRNRSPAPAPLVLELDVGDGGTLGALGVRSGGNVLGEVRDSDWRVDASDVDTDIHVLICTTYIFLFVLACLLV